MIKCQNCGNTNTGESNFCRYCGTRFSQPQPQQQANAYDFAPPRPYLWQTDELRTKNEARKNRSTSQTQPEASFPVQAYSMPQQYLQPFHCPNCMNSYLPRKERRISTAGWIVFAVLLVAFFPLFWIGLLIKEDVMVCQVCNARSK
jgi:LITAF-like zinc ribbon domain.